MLTSVSFNSWLQMGTFARLLTTVTLDMGRARLAHGATVRALGNRSTLLVDMLKGTVRMLTIAHTMAANAGLASILFSINYHFGGVRTGLRCSRLVSWTARYFVLTAVDFWKKPGM
jgi:hypothetical protein